jgi:hypothetical protein
VLLGMIPGMPNFVFLLIGGGLGWLAWKRWSREQAEAAAPAAWRRALRMGLVTLPRDMAPHLLVGILLSGVLTALVPANFFAGRLAHGWAAYGLALLVGIPLYVCSTASIPLAAAFIHMGASPVAAMAFLIAGPATNTVMLPVLWRRIGRLGTVLYLASIAFTAVAAGVLLDWLFPSALAAVPQLPVACGACAASRWHIVAAAALLALLAPGLLPEREK